MRDHGHHAVASLTMGLNHESLPIEGYAADAGFPDLCTIPLPETCRPGWEPDTDVAPNADRHTPHDLAQLQAADGTWDLERYLPLY